MRRLSIAIATLAAAGCFAEDDEVGTAQREAQIQIYQWRSSHNTYEAANTPSGKDITWHFTASTGTPPNPLAIRHIEVDIRDTVTGGLPSGWSGTLAGNWWVAHATGGPVTVHCGTVGRFTDCLNFIKTYHKNNTTHDFITVWIDKKDDWEGYAESSAVRSPWQFDQQIAARFSATTVFTPSDVIGDSSETLRDLIIANGWPQFDALRGKIMFVLTSDANADGNERLERYIDHRGALAMAFVATYGSTQSEVTFNPAGFDSSSRKWVVIYNFEWTSTIFDGACSSATCQWMFEATDRNFLTRTWDLDDSPEYNAAGAAYANFLPVNCPWLSGQDRYDCGL